jgi:5-methylcytosine-specific restriction endonuclease McrA
MTKRRRARIDKNKLWKSTARAIRERDGNACVVCGQPHTRLNVHHLIPREIEKYWLEPLNLISLCPLHHKFSRTESFHRNPWWSFYWLQNNRPPQFEFIRKIMCPEFVLATATDLT